MVSVAVCDDDNNVVEIVKNSLLQYQVSGNYQFDIHCFSCGEDLLKSKLIYDIIFLDIEMDGIDGIKTARHIRRTNGKTKIVYITTHSECALRSYSVHPFDFVVKPISCERIIIVIDELAEYFTRLSAKKEIIQLKGEEGPLVLNLDDIYVFEYTGNRRITVFTEKASYLIRGSLSEIKSLIKEESFISPHKSFIVNMEHINRLNGLNIHTTNGLLVPVAQKKLKYFQNEFSNFIKKIHKIGVK